MKRQKDASLDRPTHTPLCHLPTFPKKNSNRSQPNEGQEPIFIRDRALDSILNCYSLHECRGQLTSSTKSCLMIIAML